jgi:hypothetical protein
MLFINRLVIMAASLTLLSHAQEKDDRVVHTIDAEKQMQEIKDSEDADSAELMKEWEESMNGFVPEDMITV